MRKYIAIGLFYFCAFAEAVAQVSGGASGTTSGNPLKSVVIPPSPTAAALGKYGDIPVDMSTGIPNISIPLYTAESGTIKMPISLSYHASGLKANEAASWVGLGWSLNAGGVITRTAKGSPDDLTQILPETYPAYNVDYAHPGADMNGYLFYKNLSNGTVDAEPDVFYFNVLGQSGKFIRWGDGTFRTIEHSPMKITPTYGTLNLSSGVGCSGWLSFVITDASGIKYYFGGASATEISMPPVGSMHAVSQYFSSWYLTKIEAPDGSHMEFEYTTHEMTQTNLGGESYERFLDRRFAGENPPTTTTYENMDSQGMENNTDVRIPNAKKLRKIIFSNGYLLANVSDRNDLPTDKKLDNITVYTTSGAVLKMYSLVYDYFSGGDTTPNSFSNPDTRLKLISLSEKDAAGKALPPHTFEYEEGSLSSMLSRQQDHWGYYNGNGSTTLLPDYPGYFGNQVQTQAGPLALSFDQNMIDYMLRVGIRKSNAEYAKRGILRKINYPTRGYTTFEYEGNSYHGDMPTMVYQNDKMQQVLHPATLSNCENFYTESDFFVLTAGTHIKLELVMPTIPNCDSPFLEGGSVDGGLKVFNMLGELQTNAFYTQNKVVYLTMPYDAKCKVYINSSGLRGAGFVKLTPFQMNALPQDAEAGGVRIKKIVHYNDGFVENTTLEYKYTLENGASSGVLAAPIRYDVSKTTRLTRYCVQSINPCNGFECASSEKPLFQPRYYADYYATLSSASASYLGNTYQGAHILYSRVEEIRGGEQKSVYEFTAKPSDKDVLTMDWYSGKMLRKILYKKAGTSYAKISETENVYNFDETREGLQYNRIKVWKVMDYSFAENKPEETQMFTSPCGSVKAYGDVFVIEPFQMDRKWTYLSLTKERIYDPSDETKFTESQTEYVYGNALHAQPTLVRKVHVSSGITYTTKNKYSSDYDCANTSDVNMLSIKAMQDAGVVASLTEEQTWKEEGIAPSEIGKMLGGKIIRYNSTNFQPEKIWVFQNAAPIVKPKPLKFGSWLLDGETQVGGKYNTFFSDFARYNQGSTTQERPRIVLSYHLSGRLASQTLEKDIPESYLWGYNNQYPVAKVLNAKAADVFYTSFEEETTNVATSSPKTGKQYLQGSYTKTLTGLSNGAYTLSLFRRVNGVWTLERSAVTVSNGTYTLSLTGEIDEVRFLPTGALMTSYTYEPLVGLLSETDTNHQTVYYEYDSFGRLKLVRDDQHNILKQNLYHYRGE